MALRFNEGGSITTLATKITSSLCAGVISSHRIRAFRLPSGKHNGVSMALNNNVQMDNSSSGGNNLEVNGSAGSAARWAANELKIDGDDNGQACEVFGLVCAAKDNNVSDAIEALKKGKVIAVPTDTLYGFACDACSELAIQKVYNIKGRSATRPLAICVADVQDIGLYGTIEHLPTGLLGTLFPGPVTLILPRGEKSILDRSLNPGLPSIGVRIPDSTFIRSLCRAFGGALALTSANLSSQPSSVCVDEFKHLWSRCALVFDAGTLPGGRAGSTIVDLTVLGSFRIVRPGSALSETIAQLRSYGLSESA